MVHKKIEFYTHHAIKNTLIVDFQYNQFGSYMTAYDLSHNNQHCNHKLRDMDRYIYFYCTIKPKNNQNQLSIRVYILGMDRHNNLHDMCKIQHFLVLYIQHSHHKVMVHRDLNIQPWAELKYDFYKMSTLTYKFHSPMKHFFLPKR